MKRLMLIVLFALSISSPALAQYKHIKTETRCVDGFKIAIVYSSTFLVSYQLRNADGTFVTCDK